MEIQARHSALIAQLLKEEDPSNKPLITLIERIRTARGPRDRTTSTQEFFEEEARSFIRETLYPVYYKQKKRANFNIWKEYYYTGGEATLPFCMTRWILFESWGRIYKELLPAAADRDAFLDTFQWMPSVAGDVAERLRFRAWERRRHLLTCW